jgi:hypothetical protein
MFLDKQLQFSSAQAITVDAVGTNVVDLSVARSIGNGEPMEVVFLVTVAATQTNGNEDYAFEVEYSNAAAQNDVRRVVGRKAFESGTPAAGFLDADLLVAGYAFSIPVPMASVAEDERYIGIRYDVAGTSPTITVSAYLQPSCMVDEPKVAYASGYAI